ncbi:MAG: hypothetical protein HOQ17_13915 [Gemmatimonadaceae bacterium]|nr:hypothetical protein [Gemmatimonadaceae bacterium]NUS34146.1 hypothetical protein [Gemmatimonadaceae bacterium]NUS48414.1 hypothetical protein [Gemmatimonadaceae bacterium]
MPFCRFSPVVPPRRRAVAPVALALLLVACERRPTPSRSESAAPPLSGAADSAARRRVESGWNGAAGPALLIQGPARDEAIALYPTADDSDAVAQLDSASMRQLPVTLVGRGGALLTGLLGAPSGDGTDECERWPLRTLQPDSVTAWGVGFVNARISPIALDSVDVLSARDSMALAAEASRLASTVTLPTDAAFQGLRFTAHDIRRFTAAPGVQGLVAHLVRRVNQEANPREEQTLLIAERDSGATTGPYQLAYVERDFGKEEAVITPEVLAGGRLAGGPPFFVVARDNDAGISYRMIERAGARRWRARWSSGAISCS